MKDAQPAIAWFFFGSFCDTQIAIMGALESKRWSELSQETPQKANMKDDDMTNDPRSPTLQYNRTPIILQEYEESPQNITVKSEFRDPRSPSVKISRTPLNVSKSALHENEEDVFESKNIEGFMNPAFNSQSSPTVASTTKDKLCLKNTTSPGDFKRKNRLGRRQSLPQKLFTDKGSTLPRSPLAQRNFSVPDDNTMKVGKNKKFTFVPKKRGFISEDFAADKENTVEHLVL